MPRPTFSPLDVAKQVQALAQSEHSIAPLVREALQVIDQALDTHGYVYKLALLEQLLCTSDEDLMNRITM